MKLTVIFVMVLLFAFFGYLYLSDAAEHSKWVAYDRCIEMKGGVTYTDYAYDDENKPILLNEDSLESEAKKYLAEGDYQKVLDCAELTGTKDSQLSGNHNTNQNKELDDETFAEIQECITKNKIGFSKKIFEEGAQKDEQMIKDDIDRVTQEVIALCTEHAKEKENK